MGGLFFRRVFCEARLTRLPGDVGIVRGAHVFGGFPLESPGKGFEQEKRSRTGKT